MQTNKKGENAFMIAAQYGNFEIVDFLIFVGCRTDSRDTQGATALHSATKS